MKCLAILQFGPIFTHDKNGKVFGDDQSNRTLAS